MDLEIIRFSRPFTQVFLDIGFNNLGEAKCVFCTAKRAGHLSLCSLYNLFFNRFEVSPVRLAYGALPVFGKISWVCAGFDIGNRIATFRIILKHIADIAAESGRNSPPLLSGLLLFRSLRAEVHVCQSHLLKNRASPADASFLFLNARAFADGREAESALFSALNPAGARRTDAEFKNHCLLLFYLFRTHFHEFHQIYHSSKTI
jgi:hypothetical protein